MKRDLVKVKPITSSFLSCEKDTETILRKLFIESRPYSDILKRLLVIPNKDCLDNDCEEYLNKIEEMSLQKLIDEKYILLNPLTEQNEHEELKSRIVLVMDNFVANSTNPEFRDCLVNFEVLCPIEHWDLGNYRQRPIKILGYIDGLLNNCRLSGIGKIQFLSAAQGDLTDKISVHGITYSAIHGSDDQIPAEEAEDANNAE